MRFGGAFIFEKPINVLLRMIGLNIVLRRILVVNLWYGINAFRF